MPVRFSTTVNNIQTIPNENNRKLVTEFYEFMKSSGTSDKYQNNNLKTIIAFGKSLDPSEIIDINYLYPQICSFEVNHLLFSYSIYL